MISQTNTFILANQRTNTNYGTNINSQSYIIGFKNLRTANRMNKIINTSQHIILPQQQEIVYISKIYIPVNAPTSRTKVNILKTKRIPVNQFMEYPNIKNIGVIYVMDIDYEGGLFFEFTALIVEPLNDLDAYRKDLLKCL